MAENVYIKSGEQPRVFAWGNYTSPSTQALVAAGAQPSLPLYKESIYSTFQGIVTGTGAVTATAVVEVSNDDETGRGVVITGRDSPGINFTTVNASATITAVGGRFDQNLVNTVIVAPGVPIGTTVSAVAAGGATLTASAAATASATVQGIFYKTNWCATPLGTITLSGTTTSNDGFTSQAPWRYVRMRLTAITGTSAVFRGIMGV